MVKVLKRTDRINKNLICIWFRFIIERLYTKLFLLFEIIKNANVIGRHTSDARNILIHFCLKYNLRYKAVINFRMKTFWLTIE